MKPAELTDLAVSDLHDLWMHIAERSERAADAIEEEIFAAIALISRHPAAGHRREDVRCRDARAWPVRTFLVIYREEPDRVTILRVVSGFRDMTRLDE